MLFAYTYSKFTDRNYMLNFTDDGPAEAAADADVPHRFAFSGILELPFGQGRRWGANANGFVNALVGDWTVTAIASIQSGRPISFTDRARNLYFNGDPERAVGELLERRRPAGLRHLRLLLRRRRGADQRRRRSGQAAQRSAHPPGQQRPLLPAPASAACAARR